MIFYKKIVQIGQQQTSNHLLKKKIQLLNTYILIWMHLSCFFIILDLIFSPENQVKDILVHIGSLMILSLLLLLNSINQFRISRVVYILFSFIVYYILSFVLSFSAYTVCYFIFLPLVVMSLYKSNTPAYVFLFLCLFVYNLSDIWLYGIQDSVQLIRALILLKDPVVTSLFIAGFYLFHYFKQLNQKNEEQLEIAYQKLKETKKSEIAYLQLKSLKAQMNPHFMFNAMNSIQNLVLKGDKHEAYQYLCKFSSMVRDNLNMSEKSFVLFEEELSLLYNYLELEKLRFRDDFKYKLIGQHNIGNIKIPSMLIQPFVENSIKHGLFQKTTRNKNITIEFEQNEIFKCTITDNGIGIRKIQKIDKENQNNKESFSTNTIKERLKLLKDYYKTDIGVEYIPVEIGTKVIVKIPYTRDDE